MAKNVKAPEPSQEITVKDESLVPGMMKITDAGMLAELEGVIGAGASDRIEDKGTPLLYTAQKGSPQIDKKQDKYIPGLEIGDLFNNITGEHFKAEGDGNGLEVLPCFMRVNYVEWMPDRGGYVGQHPRDVDMRALGAKKWLNPKNDKERSDIYEMSNGNLLVETHSYFCVLPHNFTTIVVPMSSTNLTPARTFQSLIDARKAETPTGFVVLPAFWTRFNLQTVYRDEGDYQWYQLKPSVIGPNDNPKLRAFCKAFALSCMRGEVKVAASIVEGATVDGDGKNVPI